MPPVTQPAVGFAPVAALIGAAFLYYHAVPVLSTTFFIISSGFRNQAANLGTEGYLPSGKRRLASVFGGSARRGTASIL